jgi:hypothetical protein
MESDPMEGVKRRKEFRLAYSHSPLWKECDRRLDQRVIEMQPFCRDKLILTPGH